MPNNTLLAFSSLKNREILRQSPSNFMPEYGGGCTCAASQNAISDADPAAWRIHGGKLYLNYDNEVQRLWANKLPEHIAPADRC